MKLPHPLRDATPVIVGYLPAGMTFGILASDYGMSLIDALGFSGLVFAGASQYMAINLLASGSASLQIILATFLLNFRHFLMSASLSPKLEENRAWVRMIVAYGVTDETFAVSSTHDRFGSRYLGTVNLLAWSSWFTGTTIGVLAGAFLPTSVESAMGVALYALFAALLAPMIRTTVRFLIPALAAGGIHLVLGYIDAISDGWAFIIAVSSAAALGSLLPARRGAAE